MFFVGYVFHLIVPILFPEVQLQYETQSELFRRWEGTWAETYMMVLAPVTITITTPAK